MNRKEEYQQMLQTLEGTPPQLSDAAARAKTRLQRRKRVRHLVAAPLTSAAAVALAFIMLVNVSMPFAMACGRLPFLRELAAAVAYSPSLSAAVKNEYVQPMELEQTEHEITMRIEYLIVDQKQLNIFYTLSSPIYTAMDASPEIALLDGTAMESYSISSGGMYENDDLRCFSLDLVQGDMPEGIRLVARVHDNGAHVSQEPVRAEEEEYAAPRAISEFTFELRFDPNFTSKGEIITLNEDFILDGMHLRVTTIEIYPSHIRLNLQDDASNTAWLKSLTYYVENEKGEMFGSISNGITATGSTDSPFMASHRLESSFFSQSRSLTLHITDAEWLSKDMEQIEVDLLAQTASSLPQGVALVSTNCVNGTWELVFSGKEQREHASYQLFSHSYYGEQGEEYFFNASSSGTSYYDPEQMEYREEAGYFYERFWLKDYPYDTVRLTPIFSHRAHLEASVVIHVK